MAETHVVSALRAKRAEIAGHIHDLEKKVRTQRARLAHVDEVIRLFSPETDPSAIPAKKPYRRARYFSTGELPRRCLEILRERKGEPITTKDMAIRMMADKRLPADEATLTTSVSERTLGVLRRFLKRGTVVKSGAGRSTHWSIGADAL